MTDAEIQDSEAEPQGAPSLAKNFQAGFEALPASRRFTPEQLEVIYGLAYAHAQQQQWHKAVGIFALLSQYGPTRQHYLAGLALCLQKLERYEDAITIHSLMLVLFEGRLDPALRIAECQLAQGRSAAALASLRQLDAALAESDALKTRTRTLIERLNLSTKAASAST